MKPMTEAEIAVYVAFKQAEWAKADSMTLREAIDHYVDKQSPSEASLMEWCDEMEIRTGGAFYDWYVDFSWYSDCYKDEAGFRPRSYDRQTMHDWSVRRMREGTSRWDPVRAAA